MRHTPTRLLSMASAIAVALALASTAPAWGQDVAQPPSAGRDAPPGAGVLQERVPPSAGLIQLVTIERHGRLLVLTYGPTVGEVLLAGVLQLLISGQTMNPRMLLMQSVGGFALGVCLYAVNLPYMLLMFRCSFFRQRFRVWLGVESSGTASPLP